MRSGTLPGRSSNAVTAGPGPGPGGCARSPARDRDLARVPLTVSRSGRATVTLSPGQPARSSRRAGRPPASDGESESPWHGQHQAQARRAGGPLTGSESRGSHGASDGEAVTVRRVAGRAGPAGHGAAGPRPPDSETQSFGGWPPAAAA